MVHQAPSLLLTLFIAFLTQTLAQDSTNTTTTTTTSPTPTLTRIVDLFFLNERDYEGLPYTLFHRDSGSVVAVDTANGLTTYVITTTRVDRRPPASAATRTDNITTAIPTLASTRSRHWRPLNGTGQPSTITQGPATFLFTGTRYGPDHTVINRCSLNGTLRAACNLTHVGRVWYTRDPSWNGTYSTYSYDWTSGDRFGFAPVTVTAGAELLTAPRPTASGSGSGTSSSGAGSGSVAGMARGAAVWVLGLAWWAVWWVGVGLL